MVFQSEREPDNPFFQIYLMDFTTGDMQRISPGIGKTTCAWIHPDGKQVLFASTHEDPEAQQKQKRRAAAAGDGNNPTLQLGLRRELRPLSFRSARRKIHEPDECAGLRCGGLLVARRTADCLRVQPRGLRAGTERRGAATFGDRPVGVRRPLLHEFRRHQRASADGRPGYDGGPFFSPDGRRIGWRRFSEDGATAEIMTMAVDGTGPETAHSPRSAMSWAPFYHPSGQYLIFATNRHGFANFELYLVDAEGSHRNRCE